MKTIHTPRLYAPPYLNEQLLADILLRAEQDRHAAMSRFNLDSDEYQTADRRVQDVLILFRDRRAA
jgi:hypothetical protein